MLKRLGLKYEPASSQFRVEQVKNMEELEALEQHLENPDEAEKMVHISFNIIRLFLVGGVLVLYYIYRLVW